MLTIWVRTSVNEPLSSPSRMSPQQQSRYNALEPRLGLSTNDRRILWRNQLEIAIVPHKQTRRAGSPCGPADLGWLLEPILMKSLIPGVRTLSGVVTLRKPEETGRRKWGVLKGNLGECGLKERNQTMPECGDNLPVF